MTIALLFLIDLAAALGVAAAGEFSSDDLEDAWGAFYLLYGPVSSEQQVLLDRRYEDGDAPPGWTWVKYQGGVRLRHLVPFGFENVVYRRMFGGVTEGSPHAWRKRLRGLTESERRRIDRVLIQLAPVYMILHSADGTASLFNRNYQHICDVEESVAERFVEDPVVRHVSWWEGWQTTVEGRRFYGNAEWIEVRLAR